MKMSEATALYNGETNNSTNDEMLDKFRGVLMKLNGDVEARKTARSDFEAEWMSATRQYHGMYDAATDARLKQNEASGARNSQLSANKTREKTNALSARLINMMFPTGDGDNNFSIQPTPIPELVEATKDATSQRENAETQAQVDQIEAQEAPARSLMQEADDRSKAMSDKIEDQLVECGYQRDTRQQVEQACRIGTGIKMGPLPDQDPSLMWAETEEGEWALRVEETAEPRFHWIDTWNFYPSVGATSVEDSEGFMVLHPWTKRQLRHFAKIPGVNKNAVRDLLQAGPSETIPSHLEDLKALSSGNNTAKGCYCIWQYVGPIEAEDLRIIGWGARDGDAITDGSDADPLDELSVIIWFCGSEVLRVSTYPLDSGEPVFSRFCLEKREGCFWGYGVPYMMQDDQSALNAAWRMMMDNADIASGGMLVVDRKKITPVDGNWNLYGRKVFDIKDSEDMTGREFQYVEVPVRQDQLQNIMATARNQIDEATGIPQLAQGQQGSTTKTAQGMTLLMNSANVVFGRIVQNYDDEVTVPEIRRLYHYNMQFSEDDSIKGDYKVRAIGSSSLLVREMQAQNLMTLLTILGNDPEIEITEMKREIFRAHSLPTDRFVKSDEKISQEAEGQGNPEMDALQGEREFQMQMEDMKINASIALAEAKQDGQEQLAQMTLDAAMVRYAEDKNVDLERAYAQLTNAREQREHSERIAAAEIAAKRESGSQATLQVANT